jgi:hypothetical protein
MLETMSGIGIFIKKMNNDFLFFKMSKGYILNLGLGPFHTLEHV